MKISKVVRLLVLIFVVVATAPPTQGATIPFVHQGATDPLTEGWVLIGNFLNTDVGPLNPDPLGGLDAWFVENTGAAINNWAAYQVVPTTEHFSQAATLGWSLVVTLRLPGIQVGYTGAPAVSFRNGSLNYQMHFGTDSGFPGVRLIGGATFISEETGDVYHTYEMRFDPTVGSADLFVDGIERLSDYGGTVDAGTQKKFLWGSFNDSPGHGNFHQVKFIISPAGTGDFNFDGSIDALDIDLMREAIDLNNMGFNVNGDTFINGGDMDYLIEVILETSYGDADLNGITAFPDFVALANNFGLDDTGWAQGNFNLDFRTDFLDFAILSNNFGMRAMSEPVPEPRTLMLLTLGLLRVRPRRSL